MGTDITADYSALRSVNGDNTADADGDLAFLPTSLLDQAEGCDTK